MTNYNGTSGNDRLVGDWRDDSFDITQGGSDTVIAGGGDDLIAVNNIQIERDHIVGGAGFDTALIYFYYNDVTMAFDGENLSGVERILISTGSAASSGTLNMTLGDGVATPDLKGGVLQIQDGAYDTAKVNIDASAETDTPLLFVAGEATDTFWGGAMGDTFDFTDSYGRASGFGGGGDDVFDFNQGDFTQNSLADGGDGNDTVRIHGQEAFLDVALRPQTSRI